MPDPSPENEAANAAATTENEATNAVASSSPAGTVSTAENEEKPKLFENVTHYFRLLVYAQPTSLDITLLVAGLVCAIASGIPFPLLGIIFGQLIDDLNSATCASDSSQDASYQSDVDGKILYVVYLAIAQFGFMYIHLSCWSLGGARLAQRLREQYLRSLLRQAPSFFDRLPGGAVSSRLNSDIQSIRNGTSEKVGICISSVSFFVTAYVVAFVKDAALAGILVSLVPAYMAMSWAGNHFVERFAGRMSDHVAAAAAIASEGLSNVLVVHAFSANARLEQRFAADLRRSQQAGVKKAVASGVQAGLMYFIAYAANALAFWEGSRIVAAAVARDSAGATVGTIFTVIFILVDATLVLSQVAPYLQVFGAASAAFAKLRRDMDAVSAIDGTAPTGTRVPATAGRLELRAVTFAYPSRPAAPVLRDVSLVAAPGAHTAIVGLSGSGKSTVAGLASRLYDPDGGRVLLDGADLRALNTRDVRAHVSLVQQDALLLDRSILESVAHGLVNSPDPRHAALREKLLGPQLARVAEAVRGGADALEAARKQGPEMVEVVELVQRAAEQADAASFIAGLKGGLGTRVGPGGRLLSGGQKQRVALARALVKNPKILILDEATASLDSRSEQAILAAIEKVSEGRTMISIAHRLSTIKNADKIIVLRDGVVLEEGGHAELMAKEGAYFDLVRLQNTSSDSAHSKTSSAAGSVTDLSDAASIEKASGSGAERGTAEVTDEKSETSATETPAVDDEEKTATPTERSLGNIIAETCRMARPHILVVLLALLGATIVGGAFSAEAVIFGNTVQSLNPCKSEESILWHGRFFGLMFFVLAIIEFFANLVSWSGFGYVAEKIMYRVRVLSFRALFEQDLQWHQSEGRTPSSLLSIITNDGNLLGGLSGSIIGTIFSIIVNLVAAVILTHVVAWRIALVCLAIVPLLLGVGIQQLRVLAQFEERHENAYAESVGIGVEAANSIKAIASLSLEHETLEVYRRSLKGPKEETTLVSLHASLWLAAAYFIGNLGYALAYWWGSKQIIGGYYSQAQFLIVVFSLLVSAQLWSQMFALAPEVSSARAAIARILNIIELNPDQKLSGSRPLPDAGAASEKEKDVEASAESSPRNGSGGVGIAFRDVKFAYPARPNAPVLHGMDLEIRPGQFAAFVGPSGAGKSTIISLVERMYVPSSGSILVDGADITRRSDTRFRDDMALVPQESVLFGGSIRFNMGLGARPGHTATDGEIEEACRLANIHDTIAGLPQGYDTLCGPNGSQLSGGQKQRLAIARALVRRPRLLILDESTSALDAESEKLLQDGLARAARGITVLAIAHRLHTIRKADVIFLIEAGRCIDRGTHDELFERSESYRTNVLHQTSGV